MLRARGSSGPCLTPCPVPLLPLCVLELRPSVMNLVAQAVGICLLCERPQFDPWGRMTPGEVNGDPLQYSCLENPMNRGAWWATAHGLAKSRTRLSDSVCVCVD